MSGFPYDDLTDEEGTAEIEKALPGKADGKRCTIEELDAYFDKG